MSNTTTDGERNSDITAHADLPAAARESNGNVCQASEVERTHAAAERHEQSWRLANRLALDSSNDFVAKHGLPLARLRNF
jgi:antitoxin CcdA